MPQTVVPKLRCVAVIPELLTVAFGRSTKVNKKYQPIFRFKPKMEKKGSVKKLTISNRYYPPKTNPLLRRKLHVVSFFSLFGTLQTGSHFSSPKTNCFLILSLISANLYKSAICVKPFFSINMIISNLSEHLCSIPVITVSKIGTSTKNNKSKHQYFPWSILATGTGASGSPNLSTGAKSCSTIGYEPSAGAALSPIMACGHEVPKLSKGAKSDRSRHRCLLGSKGSTCL